MEGKKSSSENLGQMIKELKREAQTRLDVDEALKASETRYRRLFETAEDGILILDADTEEVMDVNPFLIKMLGYSYAEFVGKKLWEIGPFKDREESKAAFQELQRKRYVRYEDLPLETSDGQLIEVEFVSNVYAVNHSKVIQCNIRNITKRKRAEKRLNHEAEWKNLLLRLYEKAPQLTDKELYEYVIEQTVRLSASTIGFFHLVAEDQKTVTLTTWNGEALKNCTASYETHYPIEQAGNWVDCFRLKRPVIYNDFPNSPNQKGLPERHTPVRRFMSIPVVEEDKVRIIFGVGNKTEEYDEHDVVQIQLVANELQRIIKQRRSEEAVKEAKNKLEERVKRRTQELRNANTVLALEIKERTQVAKLLTESEGELRILSSQLIIALEDERKRIAMELHDDISSKLAAIKFALERRLMHPSEIIYQGNKLFEDIIDTVKDTMTSIRMIMNNLRPAMIDDLGLLPTIVWFCREFRKVYDTINIANELDIEEKEIPEDLKIVIFRVIQEAMNNIGKHSEASQVRICLKRINGAIKLLVEDNGQGFDVEKKNTAHGKYKRFGLTSMKERTRQSGGSFSIESLKGKGSVIQVTWPHTT